MATEITVPNLDVDTAVASGAFTDGAAGQGANTDVRYSGPFGNFTLTAEQIAAAQAAAGGGAGATTGPNTASSVAANADTVGGVNVAETSANILDNPVEFLTGQGATLTGAVDAIDPNTVGTNLNNADYNMNVGGLSGTATQVGTATAGAQGYAAELGSAQQAATNFRRDGNYS